MRWKDSQLDQTNKRTTMILDPVANQQPSKKEQEALGERMRAVEEHPPEDLPPDYTSVLENGAAAAAAGGGADGVPNTTSPQVVPPISQSQPLSRARNLNLPDLKPSNFVNLSRANSSVKGVWIIDPSLFIPAAFLPPLPSGQTEETRENLYLQTRNGVVEAEVYLLPRTPVSVMDYARGNDDVDVGKNAPPAWNRRRPQVVFRARSNNGSVTMKIHEVPAEHPPKTNTKSTLEPQAEDTESNSRPPLQVDCFSSNGSIHISIPRSFHGPLAISTRNGSVHFSDSVKPLLTHFSEVNGGQRSFLGDFADASKWRGGLLSPSAFGQGAGEWVGDMLKAESMNGSVRISFDDESSSSNTSSRPNSKSQGGFFGRIFGGF